MAQWVNFYGEKYEVKVIGKRHTPAKSYTDFNGYETDRPAETKNIMAMYDKGGNKCYNITQDGRIFHLEGGKQAGTGKIQTVHNIEN